MVIFWFFVALTFLGFIAYGLQIWAVKEKLKEKLNTIESDFHPPVSILKPLKGLDYNLFDNIESFCLQNYPNYEIIFSVQDKNDPAYKIAEKIKDKYPDRDITVIAEKCNIGLNPKVNNLTKAYEISKYAYILISDSNVIVGENYLRETIKHMEDPDVGLVSNLIEGVGANTIASIFENLHINSFVIGNVCLLDKLFNMPCVVGKSMLIRKSDFESIGGFDAVKDLLAEDYMIGEKIHKKSKKVVLSNYIINNVNEYWNLRKFLNRHSRWAKIRFRIGGVKYIVELLINSTLMSFIPILVLGPSKVTISLAVTSSLLKSLGDYYLGIIIRKSNYDKTSSRPFIRAVKPLQYILSPIKDLVIGLIWFIPILHKKVEWRGNKYTIGKDTLLSPIITVQNINLENSAPLR